MKRSPLLASASLILGAVIGASLLPTQARAIAIFFDPASLDAFAFGIGDQITLDLRLDTEGETDLELVAVSVQVDPNVLSFAGGTAPAQILFDPDTLLGLARLSQPSVSAFDPRGAVRAASFGAAQPSGVASSDQLLATLTFDVVGVGSPTMSAFFGQGDDMIVNGLSVKDSVTLGSLVITPEPGAALLLGLGLAGLTVSRRRG